MDSEITVTEKVMGAFTPSNWLGVESSCPNETPYVAATATAPVQYWRPGVNAVDIHHELGYCNPEGRSVALCGWTGSALRPRSIAEKPLPAHIVSADGIVVCTFCLACKR